MQPTYGFATKYMIKETWASKGLKIDIWLWSKYLSAIRPKLGTKSKQMKPAKKLK